MIHSEVWAHLEFEVALAIGGLYHLQMITLDSSSCFLNLTKNTSEVGPCNVKCSNVVVQDNSGGT